jgi:hypothetical protein
MLKLGLETLMKGADYYEAGYRQHRMKCLIKQAAALNLQATPLGEFP